MMYHWQCTHWCTRLPLFCILQYSFPVLSVQLTVQTLVTSKCYHTFGQVKVFTALLTKIAVFLDMTFWWYVISYVSFGGTCSLHHQGSLLQLPWRWKQQSPSAMSVTSYQSIQHKKQDCNLTNPCICGRLPADIVSSNPTGGIDVCLLWVLCVVKQRSLQWADHSSKEVLTTVVHNCVWSGNIVKEEALAHRVPFMSKTNKCYQSLISTNTPVKGIVRQMMQNRGGDHQRGKCTTWKKTDTEWINPWDVLLWFQYDRTKYSSCKTYTWTAKSLIQNAMHTMLCKCTP